MSNQKKFGAFVGVFTPSLLTILGVIMYMRLGWVVGNAGLIGTLVIVVIAHVISITTGLSISAIATDKKIGAGGVYYVLSRSLGLPIGGAIGITLFTGTAMSIALYLIGFAESFNGYFGIAADINGLRMGGSLALICLTVLALISTSLALKAQFFIMAAIVISLLAIIFGVSPQVPQTLQYVAAEGNVSMETIFAVFFPAVTGFTAGIAMSGDLKDPKKSIPSGTLWAIFVGFIVYIGLAIFLFFSVDAELLKTDNNIMLKLALFAPAVVAGIWGATLSSALGGILGGPRILQAMSVDKITPRIFQIGVGKGNEPRNALILTVLIAEAGILIGELDTIARVCSMFYLAAYGFINLSFFLESWASADFKPTFKVKKWIGLVGFIATFVVMFRLDMFAMIVAFLVIGGIYFWLARKELALGSGDVWQSVWSSVVKTGLRRMDDKEDHKRNWKPNVLLFSGGTDQRPHLLEFSKELVGNRGIVTNFDLHENQEATLLFPKHQQSVSDEILKKYGVFGRQIEVKNIFKGIESIASTFGFSGIEPNTILMGWAKNTEDPIWFAQMTQKLIDLDYNVLYLDYDWRFGFRKYSTIDLWWRGIGNNAELMLNIAKFLLASELWRQAQIRILLVDDTNSNQKVIEKKIQHILEEQRLTAVVKIIGNAGDKRRPLYELMKLYSSETDLVLVGIPEVRLDQVKKFVTKTNDLVGTIGTTLLVKASSQFSDIRLTAEPRTPLLANPGQLPFTPDLPVRVPAEDSALNAAVDQLEQRLATGMATLAEHAFGPIQEKYLAWYQGLLTSLDTLGDSAVRDEENYRAFEAFFKQLQDTLASLREQEIPVLAELFAEENTTYLDTLAEAFSALPRQLKINSGGRRTVYQTKQIASQLQMINLLPALRQVYLDFGDNLYRNLSKTTSEIVSKTYHLFELDGFAGAGEHANTAVRSTVDELLPFVQAQRQFIQNLVAQISHQLLTAGRVFSNEWVAVCQHEEPLLRQQEIKKQANKSTQKAYLQDLRAFPGTWRNNQQLIHRTLETNLVFAQANLRINRGINRLFTSLNQEVTQRVTVQFAEDAETLQRIQQAFERGEPIEVTAQFKLNDTPFPSAETWTQQLLAETTTIPRLMDQDAVLMNKLMFADFANQQLDGGGATTLNLAMIVDFVLDTKFHDLLPNQIEAYLSDSAMLYYNQNNRVNLLKYALVEAQDQEEIATLLQTVKQRLATESDQLETANMKLDERIKSIAYDLQLELDSRFLVEHADNWRSHIKASKRNRGIAEAKRKLRSLFVGLYDDFTKVIAAKKHESVVASFEAKYNLKSNLEQGLSFVNRIYPAPAASAALPFYYKQLFLGKQIPVQTNYLGRTRELAQFEQARAEGRVSPLLILGKSGAGKTHFSAYLAQQLQSARIITIDAQGVQGTIKELQQLFTKATGESGNMSQCLTALPRNSTILVNDLETWWDPAAQEDALTTLLGLVDKFSQQHYFILNANIHAMAALHKQRPIQQLIPTTIVLAPVSEAALRDIILERHQLGGLDVIYQEEKNNLERTAFKQLIGRIYAASAGNVGLGLQIWLRQIN
ncbi:MAG: hypothetical protein DA408_14045, partial [Bacteroidetes bacterium]